MIGCQRGQGAVELIAAVPALLIVALVFFQLLAIGYSAVLAGNAAEAGAIALAAGRDPVAAARDALPGWSAARARSEVSGGAVTVRVRPPGPLTGLVPRLSLAARAAVPR